MLLSQQFIVDYSATHNVVSTSTGTEKDFVISKSSAFSRLTAVVIPRHLESFAVFGGAFMGQYCVKFDAGQKWLDSHLVPLQCLGARNFPF